MRLRRGVENLFMGAMLADPICLLGSFAVVGILAIPGLLMRALDLDMAAEAAEYNMSLLTLYLMLRGLWLARRALRGDLYHKLSVSERHRG